MPRCRFILCVAICAVVAALGAGVERAAAVGYWNVPGSFCQCVGYGNGAGYHAPLVLGPISVGGWCASHEVRLPCGPCPTYGECGCANCGGACGGSAFYEPSLLPANGSQPEPAPAALRP